MYCLQETAIEWALLHLVNFYDSDFYPRLFEFDAIKKLVKCKILFDDS